MRSQQTEATRVLEKLAEDHGGYLQTSAAAAHGIGRSAFARFIDERKFEKVGRGIYLAPDAMDDEYYLLHLRYPHLIFSHDSALLIHDLTDRVPFAPTVTVRTGSNTASLRSCGVNVFSIKDDLFDLGVTYSKTINGNTIQVYDMERTICDVLRNRDWFEAQEYYGAFKYYARRKDADYSRLDNYARKFGVQEKAMEYMRLLRA